MKLEDIQIGKRYYVRSGGDMFELFCEQKTDSIAIMESRSHYCMAKPEQVLALARPGAIAQWWKNWHGQVVALMIFAASFAIINTLLRVFFPNP